VRGLTLNNKALSRSSLFFSLPLSSALSLVRILWIYKADDIAAILSMAKCVRHGLQLYQNWDTAMA
jgi:hypothetical protein